MNTRIVIGGLLIIIAALAVAVVEQQRTIRRLDVAVDEVPGLRAAKESLIKEANEASKKYADESLQRQFAEHGEQRWEEAVTPLYTPAILARLKPTPLPDGTRRIAWPNPHDLPYLIEEYCATHRR